MQNPLIDNLRARLIVNRDRYQPWQVHAGFKALVRLADVEINEEDNLQVIHAELVAGKGRTTRADEGQMLREIIALRALPGPIAGRIATQTATLEDVLFVLGYRTDLGSEAGRIGGMVQRLASRLTQLPSGGAARIPARLYHIDKELADLSHADFGLANGSWSGHCSKIRRAVELVDSDGRRRLRTSSLSTPWFALVREIKTVGGPASARGGIRGRLADLWPFIAFAEQRRLDPNDVDDAAVEAFLADNITEGLGDPFASARRVVYAWECLQKNVPGFPKQALSRVYRNGHERDHKPFHELARPLQREWTEFRRINERRNVGALKDLVVGPSAEMASGEGKLTRANRVLGTISPERWPNLTTAVVFAAHACLDSGREAQSLLDCIQPAAVERALEQKLERRRRKDPQASAKSSSLKELAQNLLTIARLTNLDTVALNAIEDLRDDVDPDLLRIEKDRHGQIKRVYATFRMGPRHRSRLEQFNDSVKLHAWFSMLPKLRERMTAVIKSGRKPTEQQTNDAIAAVLHAITQSCPIRNANLAKMTISGKDPWLRLPRIKGDRARIVIPTAFVKNRKEINMELTQDALAVIEDYLEYFRPVLATNVGAAAGNDFLFPAAGRNHRSGIHLNRVFFERNWKIGGIAVNLHVQRHITGKIILDEDPTQMSLVQILLDHKSIRTTESFYSAVNQIIAQRKFHQIVEQRRREIQHLVEHGNARLLSRRHKSKSSEHLLNHGSEP